MKRQSSVICSFVWMFFFTLSTFAQDIIIKKNGEQLKAKIIEVGKTEIKFKFFDSEDGPTISMNKDEIKAYKLKTNTGYITTTLSEDPMGISNNSILDKTSSLKFEFFSPLKQNIAINYEWMIKPGLNIEIGAGIIGPGLGGGKKEKIIFSEENIKPRGFFARAGVKFFLGNSSDFVVEGLKYAHPLKGRYIKPEISYSVFTRSSKVTPLGILNLGNPPVILERSYQSFAINIIYGRQLILGNSITAGYYIGAGYGFEEMTSNHQLDYYFNTQRYSHRFISKNHPFTFTMGLNLGIILKAPGFLTKNPGTKTDNKYDINNKNVEQIERKIK